MMHARSVMMQHSKERGEARRAELKPDGHTCRRERTRRGHVPHPSSLPLTRTAMPLRMHTTHRHGEQGLRWRARWRERGAAELIMMQRYTQHSLHPSTHALPGTTAARPHKHSAQHTPATGKAGSGMGPPGGAAATRREGREAVALFMATGALLFRALFIIIMVACV